MPALCAAFDIDERDLWLRVWDEFLNSASFLHTTVQQWTETCRFTESQLLTYYSTLDFKVDGLFVWLATIAMCTHLNYVHSNGIWMSHASESLDMCDALVVTTDMHFLAAKSQNMPAMKMEIKDGFNDPSKTASRFTCRPEVLNRLVCNVQG